MTTITDSGTDCNSTIVSLEGTATLGFDLDTLAVEEAWDSGKKETIARWTDGYKITVKQTIETTPTAV
jgi:hypothetical protein